MSERKRRHGPHADAPVRLFVVCKCPECGNELVLEGEAFAVGQHETRGAAIFHAETLAGLDREGGAELPVMVLVAGGRGGFGERGGGRCGGHA